MIYPTLEHPPFDGTLIFIFTVLSIRLELHSNNGAAKANERVKPSIPRDRIPETPFSGISEKGVFMSNRCPVAVFMKYRYNT